MLRSLVGSEMCIRDRIDVGFEQGGNAVTINSIEIVQTGPAISVSPGNVTVSETGTMADVDITLSVAPTTDVVILLTHDDSTEATVSATSLTFTPANWNTPQTITITGVDDTIADGTQNSTLTLAIDPANSADEYDLVSDATVGIVTTDNEFAPQAFDFGTATSPVETGFTRVTNTDNYSPTIGFGWTGTVENALDRGPSLSDVERDFVFTRTTANFLLDVPNGNYTVTVRLGDRNAARFDMEVSLEGAVVDLVDTNAGMFHVMTYTVNVTDGQLDVGFQQLGNAVTINSIEVDEASGSSSVMTGGSGSSKSSQSTNLLGDSVSVPLARKAQLVSPSATKDPRNTLFNAPVEQQPQIAQETPSDEDVIILDSVFEDGHVLRGL